DGRRIRYYTPFDGPRVYYGTDTYCCPCNYRRIVAELPSLVYYRADGGVAVNLYTPSQATFRLDDASNAVMIRQETGYPASGRVAQAGRAAVARGPQVFCLSRSRNKDVKGLDTVDLRLLTLDPSSIEGPIPDESVRPGGIACRVKAWRPEDFYPHAKATLELTLTEFPDPDGEATYFLVPNPADERLVDDELTENE
ncbi:hypothetical protein EBR04_07660, partial [bacterium]|nr:hypothetical protein [bacterium]